MQFAGVLTKPVSPSGVLVAVTADELELTEGELTVPDTEASPFICEVTATVGAVACTAGDDTLATTVLACCVPVATVAGEGMISALGGMGGAGTLAFTL